MSNRVQEAESGGDARGGAASYEPRLRTLFCFQGRRGVADDVWRFFLGCNVDPPDGMSNCAEHSDF